MAILTGVFHTTTNDQGVISVTPNLGTKQSARLYDTKMDLGVVGYEMESFHGASTRQFVHHQLFPKSTTAHLKQYTTEQDIYNRFYVMPDIITFNSITSTIEGHYRIWNANLTQEQVTGVSSTGVVLGTNVTQQIESETLPYSFQELQFKTFTYTIAAIGNPSFIVNTEFTTTTDVKTLIIRGFRAILFNKRPQKNFKHSYEFETRITESFNKEQRAAMTDLPVEYLEYTAFVDGHSRAYYQQLFDIGTKLKFSVPVWEDYLHVDHILKGSSTIYLNPDELKMRVFEPSQNLCIWQDEDVTEQITIKSVDSVNGIIELNTVTERAYHNAYVIPLRSTITDNKLKNDYRAIDKHVLKMNFRTTVRTNPILPTNTLSTVSGSLLITEPNYQRDADETFGYPMSKFEGVGGNLTSLLERGFSKHVSSYVWWCKDRQDLNNLVAFILQVKGRWKSFWMPRWGIEFTPDSAIQGTTVLTIQTDPRYTYDAAELVGRGIFLKTKSGEIFASKILTAFWVDNEIGLTLEDGFAFELIPENLEVFCFMDLVRLTKDKIEVVFDDIDDVTCKLEYTRVPL